MILKSHPRGCASNEVILLADSHISATYQRLSECYVGSGAASLQTGAHKGSLYLKGGISQLSYCAGPDIQFVLKLIFIFNFYVTLYIFMDYSAMTHQKYTLCNNQIHLLKGVSLPCGENIQSHVFPMR